MVLLRWRSVSSLLLVLRFSTIAFWMASQCMVHSKAAVKMFTKISSHSRSRALLASVALNFLASGTTVVLMLLISSCQDAIVWSVTGRPELRWL